MKLYYFLQVVLLVFFDIPTSQQQLETLNECERGVKRHHPSQANVYQLFARTSLLKQWIDYECDKYMIFDPKKCACVEKPIKMVTKLDKKALNLRTDGKDEKDNGGIRRKAGPRKGKPKVLWAEGEEKEIKEIIKRITKSPKYPAKVIDKFPLEDPDNNCHLHQPSPDSQSYFERWTDGQWVTEDCNFPFYTGLVWNQGKCRCEWGANRTSPIAVQESGVPAACLMMLNINFDNAEIKDVGRGVWIDVDNTDEASAVVDATADGGYSGMFRGASMIIPFFKSNVIGPTFHIGFKFKLCQGNPDTDIFLVHNDCVESSSGPSLVVSYQAWKKQIILAMRTTESDVPIQKYCTLLDPGPQESWVKIDIRYHDNYLEVKANDEVCATGDRLYGPLTTNNCPLTLLGQSFCGHVDEIIITRGCTEEAHAIS